MCLKETVPSLTKTKTTVVLNHVHPTKSLLASLPGSPREPCSFPANIHSHAVSGSSSLCLFHYSICIYFCQLSKKAPDIQVSLPRPPSNPHRGPYAHTVFSSPLPLWSCNSTFPSGLPALLEEKPPTSSIYYLETFPRSEGSLVPLLSAIFPLPRSEGSLVPSTFLFPAMPNAGHSSPLLFTTEPSCGEFYCCFHTTLHLQCLILNLTSSFIPHFLLFTVT